MKEAVEKRLLDVLKACRAVGEFTAGADYRQYTANTMMRSAVERQLEIIGEALNLALQSDPTLDERIPDLRRIVGIRNRIIHGYDSVDDMIVWDVVQSKLPTLMATIEMLMHGP